MISENEVMTLSRDDLNYTLIRIKVELHFKQLSQNWFRHFKYATLTIIIKTTS